MDEIDRICRKYDLKYSLYAGSLIGAVRHQGVIPWDDDIDVCMPRKDYDKFFELCKTELNPKFRTVTINNTKYYGYGFSKVTLKGTKVMQHGLQKKENIFELWVDIFPYDNVPDSIGSKHFHNWYNYFLIKLLEERYDGIYGIPNIAKRICFTLLHVINLFIPPKIEKKALIENMTKYKYKNTKEITSLSSPYKYYHECLPSNFFESLDEYNFCGRKYFGYHNYDFYLSKIYGDYMKLPPENKRHTHNLEIIDMKDYKNE